MQLVEQSRDEVIKVATGWVESSSTRAGSIFIVVDIGATNTRCGFCRFNPPTIVFCKTRVNSSAGLTAFFADVESKLPQSLKGALCGASITVPGPVDSVRNCAGPLANFSGEGDAKMVYPERQLPAALFPLGKTILLNDLEAASFGILGAGAWGMFPRLFRTMWRPPTDKPSSAAPTTNVRDSSSPLFFGHAVVVAPGTGLGAALLHYDRFKRRHSVVPLEFGHTNIPARPDDEFLRQYETQVKRGPYNIEFDDVCSGRGLERLYEYCAAQAMNEGSATNIPKTLPAETISVLAMKEGNPVARRAMQRYNDYLMEFCSQMTMGLMPTYIFLAGDNISKNAAWYDQPANVAAMQRRYLSHSAERMGFMSRGTVVRQVEECNLNLLGCAYIFEAQGLTTQAKRTAKL